MSTARVLAASLGALLITALVGGIGIVLWAQSQLPPSQAERVRGPHGLVGIQTGGSYAWVLPSAHGVVLVDAGLDPSATALAKEIGQRPVHAILVTHGHGDHTRGLSAFPTVPVHLGAADLGLLDGTRAPRGWLAAGFARMFGPIEVHGALQTVTDAQELNIDGLLIRAVAMPGHTDGSIAWLWEDVLFTGGAVLGGAPLSLPPPALDDDPILAEQSLQKLLPLDFDTVADGHVGYTGSARPALFRLADARLSEPTVSMRTDGTGPASPAAERTGTYVQWPASDVRGHQPSLVVFADGSSWRVGDAPAPERDGWNGRAVVARARVLAGGEGPGLPVELLELRLAGVQPAERAIAQRVGEWVSVRGVVSSFEPLTRGAAWGQGDLVLDDGSRIAVAGPIDAIAVGGPIDVSGRLDRVDAEKLRLVLPPQSGEPGPGGASH